MKDMNTFQKKTYMRPTNMKKCSSSLVEKCKSKPLRDTISHQLEWPSSENLETTDAREDVEK